MNYTFGLAGTTDKTTQCAQALLDSANFTCQWVLTPTPQPIGRQQVITPNQTEVWARQHQLPIISIEQKIDQQIKQQISDQVPVDFLVVVDFGYLVPDWLLELPRVKPINVHPSALPAWRGSSPGQFALLYGGLGAGITIMVMNQGLDEGPLLWQQTFTPAPDWTQTEYYQHSLELASQELPRVLTELAEGKLIPQPQPASSPTPTARQLKKADGFVAWELVAGASAADTSPNDGSTDTSALLQQVKQETGQPWPKVIAQAANALQPWPELWTYLPTTKGLKRMKIIRCHLENNQLKLETVQIEGQQPASWNQVKNIAKN